MRATEREPKRRKQALPKDKLKVDTSVNGDTHILAEQHKEVEKRLFPMRIDHRTVIYVTKDKLTPEYAEEKRRQLSSVHEVEKKSGGCRVTVDVEEVRSLVASGMHLKGIAKKIGVSRTTIEKYIKKYNLRKLKLQSLKDIDLLEKGKIIRYYLEGYFMLKSSNIILLAPEEKRCLCQ